MINKVNLCGYVGKDPTIREVGETKVAQVTLATSRTWRDKKGEKQTETQWHNLVIWGKPAEVVEKYVTKGKLIQVFGELTYRSYDDKDGVKHYVTEIRVNEFVLMPQGNGNENEKTDERSAAAEQGDDLPF